MTRILIAVCVVLLLSLLWVTDRQQMTITKVSGELERSEAKATSLAGTLRLQRELIADAEELDRRANKELTDAQAENAMLRDAVAAGTKRLYVKASCPRVSDDTSAARMDDAGAAELDADARQDYYALRDQLTLTERALSGLQEWVSRVCLK